MKILSPAGNFDCLKAAVFNGADEVYLGINHFNARNNIDGFTINSLKEAVDFAHIFNVKVNLAVNILFSNEELQEALDLIVEAYNLGVDYFIIQDLGLAKLIHDNYPEIEIHASTQMGIHNLEGVLSVLKYGFKRIVLARETPLEEIKRIRQNTSVELEYFAQGALCVSFSGNCYLSSYLCNASGNRGKCKQLCRLPYTFLKNGMPLKSGYLLSAKDFNLINRLPDLKNAGIDVIKIEGRARRPFYVAAATREYFNALNNKQIDINNLKLAFNRNYTEGYFNNNGNIISNIQNHIGITIGKVEKVKKGSKFNEVYISSKQKLSPKSTFKFFDSNIEKNTLTAYDLKEISKNYYVLTTTQNVSTGSLVNLIIDSELESQLLSITKKRDININLSLETGNPIKAYFYVDNKLYEVLGEVLQSANNQPLTKQDILVNFNKSNLFNAKINFVKFNNVFLQKRSLNEFRRTVFNKVYDVLTTVNKQKLQKTQIQTNFKTIVFNDFQIVENRNEKLISKNIIYSPSYYDLQDIKSFYDLCMQNKKNFYLDTPNFALKEDIDLLKNIIEKTQVSIVANNYYALTFNTNIIIGAGLNVYNNKTAQIYNAPIITAESNISSKIDFAYMTLRHCPLKSHLESTCSACKYCDNYAFKMDNGQILKLKRKKLTSCTFYLTK